MNPASDRAIASLAVENQRRVVTTRTVGFTVIEASTCFGPEAAHM
jgi:hypothetical protein